MVRRLRSVLSAAIALVALSAAAPASASQVGNGRNFGLGVTLGAPSGLSMKYFMGQNHALDLGVGVGFFGGNTLSVHLDYHWHAAMLTKTSAFDLPFYIGVGGRFNFWFKDEYHHYWGGESHSGRIGAGVRVPFGIAFHLNKVPLDIYLEIVPGLGVFPGVGAFLDGAVGVRYFF